MDTLRSQRGAITTYAALKSALLSHKHMMRVMFLKSFSANTARFSHLFLVSGGFPSAGSYSAIPGGSAPSAATAGALNSGLPTLASGDKAFLVSLGMYSAIGLRMGFLIDLLVAAGGIDANFNSTQTTNTTALTRYTSGAGVMMFLEATATLGATPANFTVTKYTNQAGTTLQANAAQAVTISSAAQQLPCVSIQPFLPLASGDYGVQSVEEVQFSAAMGSGVAALCLCQVLAAIPSFVGGGVAQKSDAMGNIEGATEIVKTSGNVMGCLSLLLRANTSTTVEYGGDVDIAVGS